ncbi:MAG: glucosyl-3-phosphoglycerate synthase [Actinobacteria bacterium]|nr:glucosyl-3-phosphoglycerate synthase [Actinomycetota bacterium]
MDPERWLVERTYLGSRIDPIELLARRRASGTTVSVCLPALNVASTVGAIVSTIRERWMERLPLVDEIVVVDGQSTDATAARALAAGARVVREADILPETGSGHGKGDALWKSLAATSGDIVLWLDADVHAFDDAFVPGMLGPLILDPEISYVKARYRRSFGGDPLGGGRVTEICAKPLLNLFYPELVGFAQPLSGEAAGRRELLESVPFLTGYAVEIGLLIDILRHAGVEAMAQVDLGERHHDHQATHALGRMSYAILQAVARRLAQDGRATFLTGEPGPYRRPLVEPVGGPRFEVTDVTLVERPPMREYLARRPATP